jgi:hypothetical protein
VPSLDGLELAMPRIIHLLTLATAACTQAYAPGGPLADAPPDPAPQSPTLRVLLTDAPGSFEEAWVQISEVSIEAPSGWQAVTTQPQALDLLTLQNGVTAALGAAALAPGAYGQLRLMVDSAYVMTGGQREELRIASGAHTGIKILLSAALEAGMTYQLVLDFDAQESIEQTGQGWLMTPVVRVKELVGTPTVPPDAGAPDAPDVEGR